MSGFDGVYYPCRTEAKNEVVRDSGKFSCVCFFSLQSNDIQISTFRTHKPQRSFRYRDEEKKQKETKPITEEEEEKR